MKNFKEFSAKYPDSARDLLEMSKEEILEHYAREVAEKDELAEFKQTYDDATEDLECIMSYGVNWMKKNKKVDNYHIHIDKKEGKLIYTNIEKRFV